MVTIDYWESNQYLVHLSLVKHQAQILVLQAVLSFWWIIGHTYHWFMRCGGLPDLLYKCSKIWGKIFEIVPIGSYNSSNFIFLWLIIVFLAYVIFSVKWNLILFGKINPNSHKNKRTKDAFLVHGKMFGTFLLEREEN